MFTILFLQMGAIENPIENVIAIIIFRFQVRSSLIFGKNRGHFSTAWGRGIVPPSRTPMALGMWKDAKFALIEILFKTSSQYSAFFNDPMIDRTYCFDENWNVNGIEINYNIF